MRILIPLILLLSSLSGCKTSYEYLTVNSAQMQKTPQHQLSWENDTMRIDYTFHGAWGPVAVSIFNKTSQPLYINWKKSAFIRDERPIVLYDPQVNFSATVDGTNYRLGRTISTSAQIGGSFALPEGVEFIPPVSTVSKALLSLGNTGSLFVHLPDSTRWQTIRQNNGFKGK